MSAQTVSLHLVFGRIVNYAFKVEIEKKPFDVGYLLHQDIFVIGTKILINATTTAAITEKQ